MTLTKSREDSDRKTISGFLQTYFDYNDELGRFVRLYHFSKHYIVI